jgi:hypothetical protein
VALEPVRTLDTLLLCQFNSLTQVDYSAGAAALEVHGATLAPGRWGQGLLLGPGQHVTLSPERNLLPECGTIMFWFKPNWSNRPRTGSHALLSWGWADGSWAEPKLGNGYCVLSDGWWEAGGGANRTYLVFENQLYAHCSSDRIEFRQGEWMHVAFSWEFAKRLKIVLYINAEPVAWSAAHREHPFVPALRTPVFLGGDQGTPGPGGRCADGVIDALQIFGRVLDDAAIRELYRAQEPAWQESEARKNTWLSKVLSQPYTPRRDAQGRILESRAILDEGTGWASPEGAEKTVARITAANFNVYIPCVWHGRGAAWPSALAPVDKSVASVMAKAPDYDPLANLIRLAHGRGIEVHPWFCVSYCDPHWEHFREFREEGTPGGACEMHNPAFRKRIVDLILEVVDRYEVDGVNLDYIRTQGVSRSKTACENYRQRYGRDLLEDIDFRDARGWPHADLLAWQEEAVTDVVRSVAERGRAGRPGLIVSVDGHPKVPGDFPEIQGRNDFRWAQEGLIDVLYAMDYGRALRWENADAVCAALARPAAYVTIVGNYDQDRDGRVRPRDAALVAELIAFTQRKSRGNGVALYILSCLDDAQLRALQTGPFREPAVPAWVRAPASTGAR